MLLFTKDSTHLSPASQLCAFASLAQGHCGINHIACAPSNSICAHQGAGGWEAKLLWHNLPLPLVPSLVLVLMYIVKSTENVGEMHLSKLACS